MSQTASKYQQVNAEMVSRPELTPTALVSLFIWKFYPHRHRRRLHSTAPDFSLLVRLMSAGVTWGLTEQQWGVFYSSIMTRMMFWWPFNILTKKNSLKRNSCALGGCVDLQLFSSTHILAEEWNKHRKWIWVWSYVLCKEIRVSILELCFWASNVNIALESSSLFSTIHNQGITQSLGFLAWLVHTPPDSTIWD